MFFMSYLENLLQIDRLQKTEKWNYANVVKYINKSTASYLKGTTLYMQMTMNKWMFDMRFD